MIERNFGKRTGVRVPRANIGAMRLPQNTDEAVALIRHAIDSGMRYLDTSRGYGDSEIKVGKALKDGYRRKVILSTKWAPWITKIEETDDTSASCVRKRIEESMRRLDVDYLDFYQVWNIDSREHYDQATAKGGMLEGMLKAREEGLVGHLGFTTHDSVENLLSYIEEADWCEVLLFSYNLLNQQYAPVIEAAHAKGLGTIIMNPVGGGMLTHSSPVLEELARQVGARSVPDMAVRFILSNLTVDTILVGLNQLPDVDRTLASLNDGPFSEEAMAVIAARLEEIRKDREAFCTGCQYCLPCPQDIDIPGIMSAIAQYRFWGFEDLARENYRNLKTALATACVQCGECEPKCTQHLLIMEEMSFAAETFE